MTGLMELRCSASGRFCPGGRSPKYLGTQGYKTKGRHGQVSLLRVLRPLVLVAVMSRSAILHTIISAMLQE
jgi:hypothetical protein